MCVSTAVIAAAIVALLAVGELIVHHVNPGWLARSTTATMVASNDTSSAETSVKSSLPSSDAAFLAVVAVLGLLAAITAGKYERNRKACEVLFEIKQFLLPRYASKLARR